MALVYTGNASFAGVNFAVIQSGDGPTELNWDDVYASSAADVPYSDDSYIQIGGRQSGQRQLEVLVTAANVSAFLAKKGTSGTLTVHGESRTAALIAITNKRRRAGDYLLCSATFLG